jgi:hypothetical protein
MAQIDMVPANVNFQLTSDSTPSQFQLQLKTSTGANVVTTGAAFTSVLTPVGAVANFNNTNQNQNPAVSLFSYASGITVLSVTGSGIPPGQYRHELIMTPSGGDPQIAAFGTCTVQ